LPLTPLVSSAADQVLWSHSRGAGPKLSIGIPCSGLMQPQN